MITIAVENAGAPESGTENVECTTPATRAAFQTAAATALSSQGGFVLVVCAQPPGVTTAPEEKLLNVNKVRAVI